MSYENADFWEQRTAGDLASSAAPVDWLCSFTALQPVILPLLQQPRCSALFIGSGLSTFPEDVYNSGVREVMIVDVSKAAVAAVQARSKEAGRHGMRAVKADIATPGLALPGHGAQPPAFDFAVDKGTIDCILAGTDGHSRAVSAIANVYNVLKTPGTLFLVSHSCPAERLELLQTVYWHKMQVKKVRSTPWEELDSPTEYYEELTDWEGSPAVPYEPGAAWLYILEK